MKPEWSKWVLYGWLAFGVFGFVLELIGLRNDEDNLPPLTTILVSAVKDHWWLVIPVLGLPIWLLIHFARRIY
jgi:hypothetical protein